MQWYEPKEKMTKIEWRCDASSFWRFKIISIDDNNYALYETKYNKLLKVSEDIRTLFFYAFDLQLEHERKNEFRQRNSTS